jgi:hypothetical protein
MDNAEQPLGNNNGDSLRLPQFWAENLEARLGIAEARFRLRNIEDEQIKLDLVINYLAQGVSRPHLEPGDEPIGGQPLRVHHKERLYDHQQLMVFQRVEKLHDMKALGGR